MFDLQNIHITVLQSFHNLESNNTARSSKARLKIKGKYTFAQSLVI